EAARRQAQVDGFGDLALGDRFAPVGDVHKRQSHAGHPFVAPSARPRISHFWTRSARITTGITVIIPAAARAPQFAPDSVSPTMPAIATGNVVALRFVSTSANSSSSQ